MSATEVFLGLGGNIGDSIAVLESAIRAISLIPGVSDVRSSHFYQTSPVSDIPQNTFVNAACRLYSSLSAHDLLKVLQEIEKSMGKVPKAKDAPRILDVDILFFGQEIHDDALLTIPHPSWHERLFVLMPLKDLVRTLHIPSKEKGEGGVQVDLEHYIDNFTNPFHEEVRMIETAVYTETNS
ncbi:MAG: 2-amino-4-hydroxy-6-hydroxymethyldihydropteridine diphosphokinase [Chlamydiales bacterium]|jgi:2-amino-4-hydroxy-6-hydroxymethyldihydropteridine diphosphokinase